MALHSQKLRVLYPLTYVSPIERILSFRQNVFPNGDTPLPKDWARDQAKEDRADRRLRSGKAKMREERVNLYPKKQAA